ncbi:response regulator transcription factor [Caulobacter sp. KR2-114]|uniref:response regulator transcription factor n=1 Tax=Caulobacter sp. KR2-114 TaxID=3400912 RepID=UPI003C115E98
MHVLYLHDRAVDALLVKALREIGHVVDVAREPLDEIAPAEGSHDLVLADLWRDPARRMRLAAGALAPGRGFLVAVIPAAESARVRAQTLRAGADLCFPRPVDIREFHARLRALANLGERRRIAPGDRSNLELLRDGRSVRLNGREAALSQREFQIMVYLAQRPGQVVGAEALLRHVWGEETDTQPHALARAVRRLRRHLQESVGDPLVKVVRGHGYAWREDKTRP